MDLHFTTAAASAHERKAVDECLNGLTTTHPLRQYLLPVLEAIQRREGWISPGALNYACERLHVPPAEAFGVADFYALLRTTPHPPVAIHVCDDIGCARRGAEALCAGLASAIGPEGDQANASVSWHRSPCLGACERAPAVLVAKAGERPVEAELASASVEQIVEALADSPIRDADVVRSVPQAGQSGLRLLARIGAVNPESLDDFLSTDGFAAFRRAVELGAEAVIAEVSASKLVGRGGAAFPTGLKWKAVAGAKGPKYLICNADESEPGTFKDRVLMEGDPFALIESMLVAAFATGCERGYIYIRGEYPLAARRLQHAIEKSREAGWLGTNIVGTGFDFDIEIRRGAGAYICGEETALMNSIEGLRGEPRNKPPFPTQKGLFGRPTVINNVETLVNVPHILRRGGDAFSHEGTERSTGTKLFCVSGDVRTPGVYEAPFGVTLGEMLDLAGGIAGTGRLQCILLGGAAGAFVGPEHLDVPLTFEGTRAIGATLGSAVIMPFDDSVAMGQVLQRIARFFRDESCGQCVPCRVGTVRQEELLARLCAKAPLGSVENELGLLKEVGQVMRDASICGLGHTASAAIESALARFRLFEGGR